MTLESLDFHVQTNRAFEDVEEAMSREIDVSAIQRVHHDPEQEAAVLHGGACAKAAGFPKLRHYDLRHQFVTELCEAGVPEGVIRELAGHIDPAMTRWYAHPRMTARRAAVEKLSTMSRPEIEGGYDQTSRRAKPGTMRQSQMLEKNGAPWKTISELLLQ